MSADYDVYKKLKELEIELPEPSEDLEFLRMVRPFGDNLMYVSGMGPAIAGQKSYKGTVPGKVSVEEGKIAARNCAINILAVLHDRLGNLNRIKSIVKLLVFVASDTGFTEQHLVAHGASQLFIQVFGTETGKGTRSAVGVAALPLGYAVEIEAIVELAED